MALDPTLSDLDFRRSVVKYLTTELTNIDLFFKPLTDAPTDNSGNVLDKWVLVSFGERFYGAVSSQYIIFDIYARSDDEGFEISRIHDSIMDIFLDESATDGLKSIPLYDTTSDPASWVEIGGILPIHRFSSGVMPRKDQTLVRSVTFEFKWGAK